MLARTIQQNVDPIRLIQQKRILTGQLPLDKLPRMADMLVADRGLIEVTVSAQPNDSCPKGVLVCHLKGHLKLLCQRCLEPMTLEVDDTFSLAPLKTQAQLERLPDEYVPWMIEEEQNSIWSVLEDALIIVVPFVPKHDDVNCGLARESKTLEQEDVKSPFSNLDKILKIKRK